VRQYSLRVKSRKYQQKQKWTIQGGKTKRTSLFSPFFLLSWKFASTFLCSRTRAYAKQGEQKKKRNEVLFFTYTRQDLEGKGGKPDTPKASVFLYKNCVCSVGGKRKEAAGKNVGKNKKAAR
jgi:hypothetical protein